MKPSVSTSAMVELLMGLVALGLVFALDLSQGVALSAGTGVVAATLLGLLVLLYKSQRTGSIPEGPAGVKVLVPMQALALGVRLVTVLVGGLLMKRLALEPAPWVLGFFACSLAQQMVEIRFLLAVTQSQRAVEARS